MYSGYYIEVQRGVACSEALLFVALRPTSPLLISHHRRIRKQKKHNVLRQSNSSHEQPFRAPAETQACGRKQGQRNHTVNFEHHLPSRTRARLPPVLGPAGSATYHRSTPEIRKLPRLWKTCQASGLAVTRSQVLTPGTKLATRSLAVIAGRRYLLAEFIGIPVTWRRSYGGDRPA